ncbi:MAG: aldehyde dehydrogenase [Nocardioidaceae bacterium]
MTETRSDEARSVEDWRATAATISPRTNAFIDGKAVPALDGRTSPTVNPATMSVIAEVAECSAPDIDAAVKSARGTFEAGSWSRSAPRDRKAVMQRWAQLVREHADELAVLDTIDAGKLIADTSTIDVPGSAFILDWYAELLDKTYGEIAPTGSNDLALVTREPLGVVGAVVPWNYPLEMAVWKLAPAIAAGNSVVLKPAEQSPLSVLRMAEIAAEAGLPPGVLNVVPGAGPTAGRALGMHPDVDVLTFTGSTEVGKLFLTYSGQSNMKQVWLECGGKSANLVFADVDDLEAAADAVCVGIFTNQGQVCSANSRLLVERSVKDDLLALVVDRAKALTFGDPLDPGTTFGPLVTAEHAARVMELVEAGARDGNLVLGGRASGPSPAYVEPTIIDGARPDSRIAREEVFGPVLAVFAFDQEDEAVAMANDSIYGLAASLWTGGLARAHRVAPKLRAGTVSINTVDALDVGTPFGGFGASGFGRDLSPHALDKFTGLKTTWLHRPI